MIRLGVCCGAESAQAMTDAGAQCIELGVSSALLPLMDDAAWQSRRDALMALPLPCETFNMFVPGDLHLTGTDDFRTNADTVRRYVFTALRRAKEVGGSLIVFGSGGARRVSEGFDRDTAADQIRDFLRVCAEATEETGVIIAIEPLNRGECNIINSVSEAVKNYAAVLSHPGIRVLADTYHMEQENEPLSVITKNAAYIAHVHTADTKRVPPGKGQYDHVALFRTLTNAGYAGRLCIEANFSDLPSEIGGSLQHLREAEEAANQ